MASSIRVSYQRIMKGLFFMFLILLPFQDSGLSSTPLRMFGLYLSNLPLVLMVAISAIHCIFFGRLKKNYIIILSAFYYIIFYSLAFSLYFGDDLTLSSYKLLTNCLILFFQIAAFVFAMQYFDVIKKYIWIVFVIDLLGCLLCDILALDLGEIVHRTRLSVGDERFHGFSSETSWFSYTTVLLGALSSVFTKSKYRKIIYIGLAMIVAFTGGSKGTVACLPLTFIIYSIVGLKAPKWVKLIVLCILMILTGTIFSLFIAESLEYDLNESTSFATRFSSILAGIMIFLQYPLGTGFGSITTILRESLIQAFDYLNGIVPLFLLSANEIMGMINDPTGVGLTIKSIFIQYLATFGLPFLYVLYRMIKKLVNTFSGAPGEYIVLIYYIFVSLLIFASFYYDSLVTIASLYMLVNKKVERINIKSRLAYPNYKEK